MVFFSSLTEQVENPAEEAGVDGATKVSKPASMPLNFVVSFNSSMVAATDADGAFGGGPPSVR